MRMFAWWVTTWLPGTCSRFITPGLLSATPSTATVTVPAPGARSGWPKQKYCSLEPPSPKNTTATLSVPLSRAARAAPTTNGGVALRLAREVVFFESLFKSSKWTWIFGWMFHAALLLVLLRHLRYFQQPVWTPVALIQPFGTYAGFAMVAGLAGLWARRWLVDRVRYISTPSDHLHLALLLAIGLTGLGMRFVAIPTHRKCRRSFLGVRVLADKDTNALIITAPPKTPRAVIEKLNAAINEVIAAEPIKSREHVLIANLFTNSWRAGVDLDVALAHRAAHAAMVDDKLQRRIAEQTEEHGALLFRCLQRNRGASAGFDLHQENGGLRG